MIITMVFILVGMQNKERGEIMAFLITAIALTIILVGAVITASHLNNPLEDWEDEF